MTALPPADTPAVGYLGPLVPPAVVVGLVCAAYAIAGPTIILINKHILSDLGFPYPYALTCMGLVCSSLCSAIMVRSGLVENRNRSVVTPHFYLRKVLPIGAFQALAMGFGTVAYVTLALVSSNTVLSVIGLL